MIRVFRPIPVEQLKLLVFDLDGTLIDSAQDLCNSVNATLHQFGHPSLEDTEIAGFIGDGALSDNFLKVELTTRRAANQLMDVKIGSVSATGLREHSALAIL